MRPPSCIICDADFRDAISEGDSVQFKLTDEDIMYNKRMEENHITGHPAGLEWFCGAHIKRAKKFQHLSKKEALHQMQVPYYLQDSTEWIRSTNVMLLFSKINKNWANILRMFTKNTVILTQSPSLNKNKTWSPMDNCVAPNCPYTIDSENILEYETVSIINRYSISYWNEDSVNQSLYSFRIIDKNKVLIRLTADSQKNDDIMKIRFVSDTLTTDDFKNIKDSFLSIL